MMRVQTSNQSPLRRSSPARCLLRARRPQRQSGVQSRRGFTLLELSLSLSIVGLLTVSLGSVVVLASKALPTSSAAGMSRMAAASAVDQFNQDLRFATSILESAPNRIVFTVADRNNSGTDETVAYEWAGPGEPLLRTYNNGAPAPLVSSLHLFELQYTRRLIETSTVMKIEEDSGEVLLCSFTGWPGISYGAGAATINNTSWGAEKFVVDRITFPADTTSWRVTRVSLRLRSGSSLGSGVTVGIHRPDTLLGFLPVLDPVGTPAVVPSSVLTTSYAWQDATFTDVVFTNLNELDLVIVVKPAILTNVAYFQYFSATNAPHDDYVFQMTTDAGLTWTPTTNRHRTDAPFFVYGSYQRSGEQHVVTKVHTLGHVVVTIQPEAHAGSRLVSGIHLVNQPECPAP